MICPTTQSPRKLRIGSYVGTLHEISSENSTVALENVTSYGTEGRRPEEEVPPALDNIYEFIVFRGSDVKDLRIEEGPKEVKKPDPPKMPDDPAILGVSKICALLRHACCEPSPISIVSVDEAIRMLNLRNTRKRKPLWKFPVPSF